MRKHRTAMTLLASLPAAAAATAVAQPSSFATRVLAYEPAPGQLVSNPLFNDPAHALGPPIGGGTLAPDNTKLVSLGGFGGSITLGFDRPIYDDPRNPYGMDLIVFGNAFYPSGNPGRRFAEAAVVEVSRDENGNGLADDPWYLIRGTHLGEPGTPPTACLASQTWDDDFDSALYPPLSPAWLPPGTSGQWTTTGYLLPAEIFALPVVTNPRGLGAEEEGIYGYADMSPTLILGDTDGDNIVDDPDVTPERFYTTPDDPFTVGISPGSGGGDAIDIAWAVDPLTGEPAGLTSVDFVRITTAVNAVNGVLGEVSTEVSAVAIVRPIMRSDINGDGVINSMDISEFLTLWLADVTGLSPGSGDFDGDGATNSSDISAFLTAWLARE